MEYFLVAVVAVALYALWGMLSLIFDCIERAQWRAVQVSPRDGTQPTEGEGF